MTVYLLYSCQVLELGTVDLLVQHELLEVLGSVRLSLQCLQGLHNIHTTLGAR